MSFAVKDDRYITKMFSKYAINGQISIWNFEKIRNERNKMQLNCLEKHQYVHFIVSG